MCTRHEKAYFSITISNVHNHMYIKTKLPKTTSPIIFIEMPSKSI